MRDNIDAILDAMAQTRQAAFDLLGEGNQTFSDRNLPEGARKAYIDFQSAIKSAQGSTDTFATEWANIEGEKRVTDPSVYGAKMEDARSKAETIYDASRKNALSAADQLRAELTAAAVPQLDPSREALARQEMETALSNGDITNAAMHLAANGSREATAALFSDYGKTYLQAKGEDANLILDAARGAVAQRSDGTEAQNAAAAALVQVGRIESGSLAAVDVYRHQFTDAQQAAAVGLVDRQSDSR